MKKSFPTINDVANLAKVSTSTVSHVINKTRFVSEHTKKRVLYAIQKIGYQQNMVAKSLRSRKTNMIGLVVSDIMNPFYPEVIRGIEKELLPNGYSIILVNTDDDFEQEKKLINLLYGKRVDGFIIVTAGKYCEHIRFLIDQNIPVVLLDRTFSGLCVDSVSVDNINGMFKLTERLIQDGHCKIGFITGSMNVSTGKDRLTGYLRALDKYKIPIDQDIIKYGEFKKKSGYEFIYQMREMKVLPTAVIASNNLIAEGIMDALSEIGGTLLSQIQVAVFDNMPWFRHFARHLYVASQPTFKIGEQAGLLLLERLQGKIKEPKNIVLDVELISEGILD